MNRPPPSPADAVPAALRDLLERELTPGARWAHVALLLLAAGASVALASLWMTEPALPARTQAAFAVLLAINLGWCGYAQWALRYRRVLYARHRLLAARLALAFCAVYSLGAFALAAFAGVAAGWPAGALGLVMSAAAMAMHVRADRYYAGLQRRREALERALD